MVKRRRNEMIESVTIIFNRVVDQTQIPLQWRQAAIKSIYKEGGSTMDNIIVIHAIIDKVTEPQRQGHRNTNKFFADAEKSFGKLWLKRLPNRNGRDRAQ